jgi:hypothetical protein
MNERGLDKAWVEEEEEHKLRWLINRLGTAIELRYYLIYMLVAKQRYAKALEECKRILAIAPGNLLARAWIDRMRTRRLPNPTRRLGRCRRRVSQDSVSVWSWSCISRD